MHLKKKFVLLREICHMHRRWGVKFFLYYDKYQQPIIRYLVRGTKQIKFVSVFCYKVHENRFD